MPHVEVNGFTMYYEIHGEGEPVVIATGWGTLTGEKFESLPIELRKRNRLIVYDHRGVGSSSDDGDAPGSTRLYADDVAGLMKQLGLARAHLLGRGGLGACTMQEFAINYPESVQSLVLSGGWARPDPYHTALDQILYILREQNSFESYLLAATVFGYTPEYFNEHHQRLLQPHGGWVEVRDRKKAHLKLMQAAIGHNALDRLSGITAPTLLIHPGADILAGPRLGRELQERIPGSELLILEGAPHIIASMPAAHARFGEATADWFARHPMDATLIK